MKIYKILWVDDEINHLKPHILFLENKNYKVSTCNNGLDALKIIKNNQFDIVLLDENMPGLSGLETLGELKRIKPELPVIMITKNEEEHIMDDAIGRKISDYLIKPVNPNQILIALKKILKTKNLIEETTIQSYQKDHQFQIRYLYLHHHHRHYQHKCDVHRYYAYFYWETETLDHSQRFFSRFEIVHLLFHCL